MCTNSRSAGPWQRVAEIEHRRGESPGIGEVLTILKRFQMSILAYDYRFNLDRHILSIDWEISGCGEYKLPEYQPQGASGVPTQCGPPKLAVDVYLNE